MIELSVIIPTWTVYAMLEIFAFEIVLSIIKIRIMRKQLKATNPLYRYGA